MHALRKYLSSQSKLTMCKQCILFHCFAFRLLSHVSNAFSLYSMFRQSSRVLRMFVFIPTLPHVARVFFSFQCYHMSCVHSSTFSKPNKRLPCGFCIVPQLSHTTHNSFFSQSTHDTLSRNSPLIFE